jgi:hypothetical protein
MKINDVQAVMLKKSCLSLNDKTTQITNETAN